MTNSTLINIKEAKDLLQMSSTGLSVIAGTGKSTLAQGLNSKDAMLLSLGYPNKETAGFIKAFKQAESQLGICYDASTSTCYKCMQWCFEVLNSYWKNNKVIIIDDYRDLEDVFIEAYLRHINRALLSEAEAMIARVGRATLTAPLLAAMSKDKKVIITINTIKHLNTLVKYPIIPIELQQIANNVLVCQKNNACEVLKSREGA